MYFAVTLFEECCDRWCSIAIEHRVLPSDFDRVLCASYRDHEHGHGQRLRATQLPLSGAMSCYRGDTDPAAPVTTKAKWTHTRNAVSCDRRNAAIPAEADSTRNKSGTFSA
jgi:hypothetical protein